MRLYTRPKSTLSKYRRRKLALEKTRQWLEQYHAPKEPPAEPRKEHKRTKPDPKEQKSFYRRQQEKGWRAQNEEDYYTPTQQEMTKILTVAEALALLDRMGENA